MEEFIEKNREAAIANKIKLIENVKFILNPGSRAIILNLPKKLAGFIEKKQIEQAAKKVKKQHKKPQKKDKTELELKNELINKLTSFMKRLNFAIILTTNDITDYIKENEASKCRIKCPFCGKTVLCNNVSFWVVSNIEAHLKIHTKDIAKSQQENQTKTNNQSPTIEKTAHNSSTSSPSDSHSVPNRVWPSVCQE